MLLLRRSAAADDDSLLDEAIRLAEEALDGVGIEDERMGPRVRHLRACMQERRRRRGTRDAGTPGTLDETDEDDGDDLHLWGASYIAGGLRADFLRSRDLASLDDAIDLTRLSVQAAPDTHPQLCLAFANLAELLRLRHSVTGVFSDLQTAVYYARRAIEQLDDDASHAAGAYMNAAYALRDSFTATSDRSYLDEALTVAEAATAAATEAPPDSEVAASRVWELFASVLVLRFEAFGQIEDLDKGLTAYERALAFARQDRDSADTASLQTNLAVALRLRYEVHQHDEDLQRSLELAENAVRLLNREDSHRFKIAACNNLGLSVLMAADRDGSVVETDRAIELFQQIVTDPLASPDDMRRAAGNLAGCYLQRYELANEVSDLDRAIEYARGLVERMSGMLTDSPGFVAKLAQALLMRYEQRGDPRDLDDSLAVTSDLPSALSGTHGSTARYARALALELLAERTHSDDDLQTAEAELAALAHDNGTPTMLRRITAVRLARLAAGRENWYTAQAAYQAVMTLSSPLADQTRVNTDKRIGAPNLASDAAAVFLAVDHHADAIDIWERARAILISGSLTLRDSDLDRLEQEDLAAAQRLSDLYARREYATVPGELSAIQEKITSEVNAIRQRPKFERFLMGPSADVLIDNAASGPIVILTLSDLASYAIVIGHDGIDAIRLPHLTPRAAGAQLVELLHGVHASAPQQSSLLDVLRWLGDVVVGPVVHHLTDRKLLAGDASVVHWCLSGWLGLLPVHAAFIKQPDGPPGPAFLRFASAFSPSLRALIHSRREMDRPGGLTGRPLLVVSMPETPGAGRPLRHVRREAAMIKELFPERTRVLSGDAATPVEVASWLRDASWVHFACHGESILESPLGSRLLLGGSAGAALTVQDILDLNLPAAEFAYLSACDTANSGVTSPDQSLHLVSAFQVAGYRRVVGTLWPVNDRFAADTAEVVYRGLRARGAAETALVVREEMEQAYRDHPSLPKTWASFVYFGA